MTKKKTIVDFWPVT